MIKENWRNLFEYYQFTKKDGREYPVVSRILKQLTPERIKKEIERVQKVELPPELKKWARGYEKVGYRSDVLWKWLYEAFKIFHLPIIPVSIEPKMLNIKVLFTIFITLLDDTADRNGNKHLLEPLLGIPFKKERNIDFDDLSLNFEEKGLFQLSLNLWNHILKLIKKDFKNYKKYKEIFEFDVFQALNAMRYAHIFNERPYLINKNEYWAFLPYNMCLYVYSDMDLMSCSTFNIKKFGTLREIIWDIQKTARIGNWLATWKRELSENDFSSIILAYYFEKKEIDYQKKMSDKKRLEIINDIKKQKIEKEILMEWEKSYSKIREKEKNNKDLKVNEILKILEEVILLHLANISYI